MFKNYFKIAWRSLGKNKTSSFINITGLTTGLTCCLLMVLYMQHELSYDKFQKNGDRIARVIMEYSFNGSEPTKGNFTSTKVFPSFKRNFPEVEDGVRMSDPDRLVKYEDKIFNEKKFVYADSTFFSVFNSFHLLKGQPQQVLKQKNNLVLTASAAKKYFGSIDNAVGKMLQIGSKQDSYLITGIAEDCPTNSQIQFDFIASFSTLEASQEETYWEANYTTYLLLKDKASIASLQKKIGPFMKKEMEGEGAVINYYLEPYTWIHLHSPYDGFEPNSNITYIYIIAGIALLILAIACFTYINLSTARSLERAREVGIRKVAGAIRKQVFWQFIGESFFVTMVSILLSLISAGLLLPAFNKLSGRNLQLTELTNPFVLIACVAVVLVISLLAGSYPALILSKFQPVKVLKGSFKNTSSGAWLRKSLIVFQFAISIFLIVSTFIIQQQLHYIQNKKLGYDREHVVIMNIDDKVQDKIQLVKTELKRNGDILAVSKANNTPVSIGGGYVVYRDDKSASESMNTRGNPIDDEYIPATKLEIVAGSNLSRQDLLDANQEDYKKNYYHYVVNETLVKMLGWNVNEAVGKKIFLGNERPGEIKAVVKDFHFASLHNPVEPLVLFPGGWGNTLIIKTTGKNISATLSSIEKVWKTLAPHRPFEYRFMDEDFQKLYQSENRTANVFSIFSGIAILLACLGLFGLSAYTIQQRMKEISIRKVLGASITNITILLSNRFILLVAIAFLLAAPLAWYFMNSWLQGFAYRVNISWWVFAVAAIVVLSIALVTISVLAIRAAVSNPVKSLRTE
jgi:putative ABC transport system permease protein